MSDRRKLADKTITDFGDQWRRFPGNEGYYASRELFEDIVRPLLRAEDVAGKRIAEIGSGTGRIVGMLLECGAEHVLAIEPSPDACACLRRNVSGMPRREHVTVVQARGDAWLAEGDLDLVVSIGAVHHIPEPGPVIERAFAALRPGGRLFLWLYGHEGNELYLALIRPVRRVTSRIPHLLLRGFVELLYAVIVPYMALSRMVPLPMRSYLDRVFRPLSPAARRLVIYDQLNPAYAKYYRRDEVLSLLRSAGFENLEIHHRHGYSWSATGLKPT